MVPSQGLKPILNDINGAVLMIRVGLAMNALNAQLDAGTSFRIAPAQCG